MQLRSIGPAPLYAAAANVAHLCCLHPLSLSSGYAALTLKSVFAACTRADGRLLPVTAVNTSASRRLHSFVYESPRTPAGATPTPNRRERDNSDQGLFLSLTPSLRRLQHHRSPQQPPEAVASRPSITDPLGEVLRESAKLPSASNLSKEQVSTLAQLTLSSPIVI
ncbi:unnamed protein product [Caenorhabditis brenneri]